MSDCRVAIAVLALFGMVALAGAQPRVEDPTRPYVAAPSGAAAAGRADDGIALSAVLVSSSRRIAVINGRFYREGERVAGELITKIEPGAIYLRRGESDVRISIHKGGALAVRTDGEQGQ